MTITIIVNPIAIFCVLFAFVVAVLITIILLATFIIVIFVCDFVGFKQLAYSFLWAHNYSLTREYIKCWAKVYIVVQHISYFRVPLDVFSSCALFIILISLLTPQHIAGFAALIYPCLEVVFAYPHAPYFVDCLPVAKPAPVAHIITPMAAIPLT